MVVQNEAMKAERVIKEPGNTQLIQRKSRYLDLEKSLDLGNPGL